MSQKTSRNVHLISPGYVPGNNQLYHLAVRIHEGGYALLAGNPDTKEVLILSSAEFPGADPDYLTQRLREDFSKSFHGNNSFKQSVVMNANRKVTFVPDDLYIPEKRIRYLSSCIDLDADDQLYSYGIEEIAAQGVFAVDGNIYQEINQMTSNPEYRHPVFFLPASPGNPHCSASDAEFKILVINSHLYLLVFSNHKMIFFNHFHFDTHQEMLYYLLKAKEQIAKQVHGKIFLTYAGTIEQNSEMCQCLAPYFEQPVAAQIPKNIQCHSVFNKVSWHVYADLLNAIF